MPSSLRPALLLLLGLLVPLPAVAASGAARAFSVGRSPASAVVLEVPADYLAADIEIRAEDTDWLVRLEAVEQARRALAQAAAAAGLLLHVERPLTLRAEYGKSLYGSFSSGGGDAVYRPTAELCLLARLEPGTGTLAVLRKMRALVDGLSLPKKTGVQIGELRLALDNPETHRPALLAAISRHLSETQRALGPGSTRHVARVDTPLLVSQLDERTVGLHLAFETTYVSEPAR